MTWKIYTGVFFLLVCRTNTCLTTEFLEFMYYVLPVQRSITDHKGFFPVFEL